MYELFNFFIRNSRWFVFLIYVVLSCMMLFNGNPYQRHVYLTSANGVVSGVYELGDNVTSYFNLRDINGELNRRNAELLSENVRLREEISKIQHLHWTDTLVPDSGVRHFDFIVARVINNSISRPFNYITIDKGRADGIEIEYGVIDRNGVVGIVSVVGEHSSRVISLLNPKFRLSCKIKRSDNFGSLVWSGTDPEIALLEELPRHTVCEPGDTIVTSGYSSVFPAGLPVGVIVDENVDRNQNFFTLRVRLFADFTTLSDVQVVKNNMREEIMAIESGAEKDGDAAKHKF